MLKCEKTPVTLIVMQILQLSIVRDIVSIYAKGILRKLEFKKCAR